MKKTYATSENINIFPITIKLQFSYSLFMEIIKENPQIFIFRNKKQAEHDINVKRRVLYVNDGTIS